MRRREVLVAMELHLDALRELDRPLPEPEGREVSAGAIQGAFENWVETLEDQAELNRPTLQTLDELTEAQRRAIGEFWAASSGPAKRKAEG